jgi:hypothetical protein
LQEKFSIDLAKYYFREKIKIPSMKYAILFFGTGFPNLRKSMK